MTTNTEELGALYKRILALEIVEKLKSCALIWNKTGGTRYKTVFQMDGHWWDVFLTKTTNLSTIVLDFKLDARYFCSLTSDDEPGVLDLLENIEFDRRQFDFFRDIQQVEGCGPQDYFEYPMGGVLCGGLVVPFRSFLDVSEGGILLGGEWTAQTILGVGTLVPSGVLGAGTAPELNLRNPPMTPAGLLADGNYYSVFTAPSGTDGPLVAGSGLLGVTYQFAPSGSILASGTGTTNGVYLPTTTGVGLLAAGSAPVGSGIGIEAAGVLAAGSSSFFSRYTPLITAAGVRGSGASTVTRSINPAITPAGVLAAGSAPNTRGLFPTLTPAGLYAADSATNNVALNGKWMIQHINANTNSLTLDNNGYTSRNSGFGTNYAYTSTRMSIVLFCVGTYNSGGVTPSGTATYQHSDSGAENNGSLISGSSSMTLFGVSTWNNLFVLYFGQYSVNASSKYFAGDMTVAFTAGTIYNWGLIAVAIWDTDFTLPQWDIATALGGTSTSPAAVFGTTVATDTSMGIGMVLAQGPGTETPTSFGANYQRGFDIGVTDPSFSTRSFYASQLHRKYPASSAAGFTATLPTSRDWIAISNVYKGTGD